MPRWFRDVQVATAPLGHAIAGAILGGVGLSLLAELYYRVTDPEVFRYDGFGYALLITLPLGGVLGGLFGFARGVAEVRRGRHTE
jgi:hypothetical protein